MTTHGPGLAAGRLQGGGAGRRRLTPALPGFQIRKGVSASAVPFTPSSPLLPCSQEGGRHTVTSIPRAQGRDGLSKRYAGEVTGVRKHTPDLSPWPCALQSKLSRHGSGADSDYENTQSGDPLLG